MCAASLQARAQDEVTIEELVITAEKREQKLQDVAVAVSAFTAGKRDLIGILSVQDIANFTPGLSYSTVNDRLSLRGVSRFSNNLATESGIANYSDGVYTTSTVEASKTPILVDRVEVLRGPQGTLYGRNAIGGAINTISRRPTSDLYGEARAAIGNYNYTQFEAAASGPINDHLRFRLAGSKIDQGKGWFHNLSGGPSEGNRLDQSYFEAQLEGDVGRFEWWLKAGGAHFDNAGGGPSGRSTMTVGAYDSVLPISDVAPNVVLGLNRPFPVSATGDVRAFDTNTPQRIQLDQNAIVSGEAILHLNGADVKYVGGYQHYLFRARSDVDNSSRSAPFPFPAGLPATLAAQNAAGTLVFPTVVADYTDDHTWFSHELSVASTGGGPLQWIAGAYQFRESFGFEPIKLSFPDQPQFSAPRLPIPGNCVGAGPCLNAAPNPERLFILNRNDGRGRSYAVYGQADYALADAFKIHLGLRYTKDRKDAFESYRLFCFLAPGCLTGPQPPQVLDVTSVPGIGASGLPAAGIAPDPSIVGPIIVDPTTGLKHRMLKASWDGVSGTAGLDWTPDTDTLAYVKYTRGYKAGGFNAAGLATFPTTRKEAIDAYELGLKKTVGRTLQANASAFYYDYQDIQVPLAGLISRVIVTSLVNVPKARITGFELETVWAPLDGLQVLANYAYLDSKLTNACCFRDPQDPTASQAGAAPVTPTGLQDLKGARLPATPRHRVTLNSVYTWRMDAGSLSGSASYIFRDGTYYSVFNRSYNYVKAFDQVDLRATWRDARDRYSIIGYVKNAFDRNGFDGVAASLQPGSRRIQQTIGLTPPRTYGVELQYRFF